MITYDTFKLPRIEANVAGEDAIAMLNAPVAATEEALNKLSMRLSNLNNKSAIIRQHVPIADGVTTGDLVYFDTEVSAFKQAQALLLSEPGANGASIEAPCARVEGLIISTDASQVTGTLLCGGYYNDNIVAELCLGGNATAGTYYLSPFNAGKAVKDPKGHLRQPVLSYHGNGELTLNVFYMAHDNHFHASIVLGNKWKPVKELTDVTAPAGAIWVYSDSNDAALINLGELSKATTAIFYNGELQPQNGNFIIDKGYLWTKMSVAPIEGSVVVFNHYPFAYDSPIIRSIESTNASLSVRNKNGLVQLTQNAFISGATAKNALSISAISDNVIQYTPVVTDILQGPGVIISAENDGTRTISSSSLIDTLIDASSINHNGTAVTSDGLYQYITFPRGRECSFIMQEHITNVNATDTINATVWGMVYGSGASFDVDMYFVPEPSIGTIIKADRNPKIRTSLSVASNSGSFGLAETPDTMTFIGKGTLIARVSNVTSSSAINLFRTGFKLSLVKASAPRDTTNRAPIEATTAIVNTMESGYSASIYDLLYVNNGKLYKCSSDVLASGNMCIGIALSSCTTGEYLDYMITGIIQDPSFNFIPGSAVYVGLNGKLTQSTGSATMKYIQKVGMALTSSVVQVNIDPAIIIGE